MVHTRLQKQLAGKGNVVVWPHKVATKNLTRCLMEGNRRGRKEKEVEVVRQWEKLLRQLDVPKESWDDVVFPTSYGLEHHFGKVSILFPGKRINVGNELTVKPDSLAVFSGKSFIALKRKWDKQAAEIKRLKREVAKLKKERKPAETLLSLK